MQVSVFLIACCIIISIFFSSGVIYSFNEYASLLVDMHVYPNANDPVLQSIPIIIFNVASLSVVTSGLFMDYFGIKAMATEGCIIFLVGLICLLYNQVFVGMCALAYGGMKLILTLYQFGNLFTNPTHQVLFRSTINSCYNLATLVFLFITYLQQYVSLQHIFMGYIYFGSIILGSVAFYFPWEIQKPKSERPVHDEYEENDDSDDDDSNTRTVRFNIDDDNDENDNIHDHINPTLPTSLSITYTPILSMNTFLLGFYFGVMLLISNIFYTTQVDPSQTQAFDLIIAIGPFFVVGLLPYHFNEIKFLNCILLTIIVMILAFMCQTTSVSGFQITSFVLFTYGRTVFINLVYDRVFKCYASDSYGRAIGAITGITIIIGLLQLIIVPLSVSSSTLCSIFVILMIIMASIVAGAEGYYVRFHPPTTSSSNNNNTNVITATATGEQ